MRFRRVPNPPASAMDHGAGNGLFFEAPHPLLRPNPAFIKCAMRQDPPCPNLSLTGWTSPPCLRPIEDGLNSGVMLRILGYKAGNGVMLQRQRFER